MLLLTSIITDLMRNAKAHIQLGQYGAARPMLDVLLLVAYADNYHALMTVCLRSSDLLWRANPGLAKKFLDFKCLLEQGYTYGNGGKSLAIDAIYQLAILMDDPQEKRRYLAEVLMAQASHIEAYKALLILDGKLKPEEIVDLENLPVQSNETQKVEARRFACPKCGSHMVFDGEGHNLICESCARAESVNPGVDDHEHDFTVAMLTGQGHRKPVAMKTFRCRGCGADFLLPPQALSETCSYCGSVYVLASTRELLEPDSIIPMAFGQREAARRLLRWVKKHEIIPGGKVQAPRGLYLPVWAFDMTGMISWKTNQEYDRFFPENKRALAEYNDLTVVATPNLADLLPATIGDFSFIGAPAYDPPYLAGWPAEVYQRPLGFASYEARKQAIERVKREKGLSHNRIYSTDGLSIRSFQLGLVPIWITEYPLEGRVFRVIINGQTGAVYGETPMRGILGWLGKLLKTQILTNPPIE